MSESKPTAHTLIGTAHSAHPGAQAASDGTLAVALAEACNHWAARPAITDGARTLSYGELGRAVGALAAGYRRLGIEPGERIVCQLPNGIEHLVAVGGAWALGAVHVAADHQLTGTELSRVLELSQARALVCAPASALSDPLEPVRTVKRRHPATLIVDAGDGPAVPGAVRLHELTRETRPPVPVGPVPGDVAAIFTTSGTTGVPKMPLGYHWRLTRSWTGLAGELGLHSEDVHLVQLPLAHGLGLMLATAALLSGGHLVVLERFHADAALKLIETAGVTVLPGSPTHFRLILARSGSHDVSSLRLGVASAGFFPVGLLREILENLVVGLLLMYGASEGVGVTTTSREDMLAGSVGRPEPGSVAIVDGEHRALPCDESGEIAFSRAFFPVRYWGQDRPAADGWFYTGDLGRLDDRGRLYITGRLKHQINRGGLKVDPVEIESALLRCTGISDATVIGLPNEVLGETICACVVPDADHRPTLARLRSELHEQLADYKLPDELCVLGTIPRTGLGKVDLGSLRAYVLDASREPAAR